MNKEDILKLAELSRLEITDSEAELYKKDFEGILKYIDSISSVDVDFNDQDQIGVLKNVMRSDDDEYKAGEFTKDILDTAPETEDGYFKVKKVL